MTRFSRRSRSLQIDMQEMHLVSPPRRQISYLEEEYQLIQPLYRAKFGGVYLARSRRGFGDVAIKMYQDLCYFPEKEETIQLEIEIACALMEHPHAIQILEVVEDEIGNIFIVMERAEMDLLDFLNLHGPCSQKRASLITKQVLHVVNFMHEKGFMHLDLSLENILVFQSGNWTKLSDFGMSRQFFSKTGKKYRGKLNYTPPEYLFEDRSPSELVDAYCIGVITFALLFGKLPYTLSSSYSEEFLAISYGDFDDFFSLALTSDDIDRVDPLALDFVTKALDIESRRWSVSKLTRHPWLLSKEDRSA